MATWVVGDRCAYSVSFAGTTLPGRSVLCLLDDPLTALDATTRDHVSQNCINGLLRRNPGAAIVVACGEISPSMSKVDDNRTVATKDTPSSPVMIQRQNTAPIRPEVPGSLNNNIPSFVSSGVLFNKIVTLASGSATTTTTTTTVDGRIMEHDCRLMRSNSGADGGNVDPHREEGEERDGLTEEMGGCSSEEMWWEAGAEAVEEEERKDGAVELRVREWPCIFCFYLSHLLRFFSKVVAIDLASKVLFRCY